MAVQRDVLSSFPPIDGTVVQSVRLLERLFENYSGPSFQVHFWNGATWKRGSDPQFTLVLTRPESLRKIFESSELALGEAYIYNDFDIEGDISSCFKVSDFLVERAEISIREKLILGALVSKLPQTHRPRKSERAAGFRGAPHSPERDRQAVSYHYDLPPSFYSLFLGARMMYSEAYFCEPQDTLDQAQEQKLHYVCKKLRLQPGESFLDLGCGWGGLIIFAAQHYGVRSTGITLSVQQENFARKRIEAEGLQDRCTVRLCDYRELSAPGEFDKIASIGMFEHVGRRMLPQYFSQLKDLLRPGGLLLNSGISYSATYHQRGPSFIDRYVFPDGDLLPISTSLRAAEEAGLEVRDVENLRGHYALTLDHWVRQLEVNAEEATRLTDDVTYRTWRLYMAGSAHAFRTGRINLFQSLLSKTSPGRSAEPMTRNSWYERAA